MIGTVYETLPVKCLDGAPNIPDKEGFIKSLLIKELPSSDHKSVEEGGAWHFKLEKHSLWNKTPKTIRKKKNFLTRKEREKLGILKLPKDDWDYGSLESMRTMWRQYMRENLELAGELPRCSSQDWTNFSLILARSELIGSEITVVRSKVPTHVGLKGTIVLETKMTFQVVTPQSQFKLIPKNTSVFEFRLDDLKFTVFGKHIMTKPSERSVKKIKSHMVPDL